MRTRVLILSLSIIVALGMTIVTLVLAQGLTNDDEATLEAAAAEAAEAQGDFVLRNAHKLFSTEPITAPLFVGIDQAIVPTYVIDPETGDSYALFDGGEIWGAAYDQENEKIYFNRGTTLFEWPLIGAPTQLGTIRSSASNNSLAMIGLAFHEGKLYASRGLNSAADPKGIYIIDTDTLKATVTISYSVPIGNVDIGGLAIDPETGTLYGTNDQAALRGLVEIDPTGNVTVVAPYPEGETDIDGLAIGNGRAYLLTDEPGDIFVYDFATLTYTNPISNPWTTAGIFSGAAWIPVTELVPSISLKKTVGTDPATCAATDSITLSAEELPASVTYCFAVTNTGKVTLTRHDLTDSLLGSILEGFTFDLAPEASVFLTQTEQITQTTINTATWTAYNEGPTDVVSATDTATVTISSFSPAISVTPVELEVTAGQNTVSNRIMTVTNTGSADLTWTLDTLGECYGIEPDWLSFDPLSGLLTPGEEASITVSFDSSTLSPGTYVHERCIKSNDPDSKYTEVKFEFTVQSYSVWLPVIGGLISNR